jgi:ankyrin repeat protein
MSIKMPSKKDLSKIIAALKADSNNTTIDWKTFCGSNNQNYFKELSEIDYRGEYLLHIACKQKAFDLVKALVLNGADVNKPSRTFGTTPLQIAFKKNDFKTAYLLYRYGANLYYINKLYTSYYDSYHGIEKQTYDVKYYARTNKAKQFFSLLEELEKDKANAKVKSDIEKLCV